MASNSADSVQSLLAKHVQVAGGSCPSLKSKRVSPHVLRHSAAMELLQAGVDCSVIALWLGHESIETTQTYLRGIQTSNGNGEVAFTTIYPGWYQGRATHIHAEVTIGGRSVKVTQIAFPESVNNTVHTSGVYASRGANPTSNAADGIFADSLSAELSYNVLNRRTAPLGLTLIATPFFGFVEGARVEILHEGIVGRDPIAVRVDNVTIAVRRREAMAIIVA